MKKNKDRNVYILIITILLVSLSVNVVGTIANIKNARANRYISYQKTFENKTNAESATVYATLNSGESYTENYGPREVSLTYGKNEIPLEIKKNNTSKTYNLVVERLDDRSSENRLNDIMINAQKINFKPDQLSYTINVDASYNSLNINASLKSAKSHFALGYGPRKITLNEGLNVAFIRVKSENGLEKDYKLNIFKNNNENTPKDDYTGSTKLESLSISDGHINFKKDEHEYKVNVQSNVEKIDVYAFSQDEKATITISGNENLQYGDNNVSIMVKNDNQEEEYKIIVCRENDNTDNKNALNLQDLNVGGFNLNFKPEKKDYEITALDNQNIIISAYPYLDSSKITILEQKQNTDVKDLKILVTGSNGIVNTYTLKIKKQFWTRKNEIIAVAITFMGGLLIVSLLKYYEIKTERKRRQKSLKKVRKK